jgi:1-acyl-sn-glycerol-3-phosphate acyltransferase
LYGFFFCRYYHRLEYTPIELPTHGPAIVVANHLSGLDPFLLFVATRRPLRFLIAREFYESFWLNWLYRAVGCIPVDRARRPEVALRAALRALQSGEVIAIFPQGKITLPTEPPRKLKRGSLWLAQQVQCPIYPVHLAGIRGMGYIMRGVFLPTRATLISYPPIHKIDENTLDQLQRLLEARY